MNVPRALGLAALAMLAACTQPRRLGTVSAPAAIVSAGPVCRVGPDDGPLVAERGIGGTGAPSTRLAERGIGGTGIVGVVTGFASICLAGHEVALPPGTPIEIGGQPSGPQALRAGQVAAVEASGRTDALTARRVVVRYEVSGPIETITGDRLQIAGQTVLLGPDTWMRTPPALGQWVAVSGLRDATFTIVATRLDLISTRTILIHGIVQRIDGTYRIGTLPIVPPLGDLLVPGLPVSVTGVYGDGGFQAASVTRDVLVADPAAYFGIYTSNFIVEGYAQPISGQIPFGTQSFAPASSRPTGSYRSIAVFQRTPTGGIRLDSVVSSVGSSLRPPSAFPSGEGRLQPAPTPSRDAAIGGRADSGSRFAPAPIPNRSLGGRVGAAAETGGRFGGGDRASSSRTPTSAAPPESGGGSSGRRR